MAVKALKGLIKLVGIMMIYIMIYVMRCLVSVVYGPATNMPVVICVFLFASKIGHPLLRTRGLFSLPAGVNTQHFEYTL